MRQSASRYVSGLHACAHALHIESGVSCQTMRADLPPLPRTSPPPTRWPSASHAQRGLVGAVWACRSDAQLTNARLGLPREAELPRCPLGGALRAPELLAGGLAPSGAALAVGHGLWRHPQALGRRVGARAPVEAPAGLARLPGWPLSHLWKPWVVGEGRSLFLCMQGRDQPRDSKHTLHVLQRPRTRLTTPNHTPTPTLPQRDPRCASQPGAATQHSSPSSTSRW